jgi:hypothetical protein
MVRKEKKTVVKDGPTVREHTTIRKVEREYDEDDW